MYHATLISRAYTYIIAVNANECAIVVMIHFSSQIMGDLATKYGFYSADWDDKTFGVGNAMGEGGEALTVTDPEEAWMFHIVSRLSIFYDVVARCVQLPIA